MEGNQDAPLFGLSIDPTAKAHLLEASRWARFLAIIGFIMIGLLVVAGLLAGSLLSTLSHNVSGSEFQRQTITAGIFGPFVLVVYIIVGALYFFPCLFLYRFASKMKTAIIAEDQASLESSFQNLKKLFRFLGILTIIVLAFYAIGLTFGLLGAGMSGMR